jgi:hypothetical protein
MYKPKKEILIGNHNGTIEAESVADKGTKLIILHPIRKKVERRGKDECIL